MKTRVVVAISIAVLAAVCACPGAGREEIKWVKTMKEAREEGRESGRPIMVSIYADWCGWCKKLDQDTYSNAEVEKLATRFVCVKVNGDRDSRTMHEMGARGFPAIVFLSPEGKQSGRIDGYLGPRDFAGRMREALKELGLPESGEGKDSARVLLGELAGKSHGEEGAGDAGGTSASELLVSAQQNLSKGQEAQCYRICSRIVKEHPESEEARKASELMRGLEEKAARILEEARHALKEKAYGQAARLLREVQKLVPGADVAKEAANAVAKMKADPEVWRQVERERMEEEAGTAWQLAKNLEEAGRIDLAIAEYRKILETYPDSEFAKGAEERLDKLAGDR